MKFHRRIDCQNSAAVTLLLLLVGTSPIGAQDPAPGRVDWSLIETIVSRIEAPQIPERVYRVATTRFWAGQEDDLGAAEDVELPGLGLRRVYEGYLRRHGLRRA